LTDPIISSPAIKKRFLESWKRINSRDYNFTDVINNLDYEFYLDEYIEHLICCVNNNLYEPKKAVTISSPKAKGLHRPVSLLYIEDALLFDFLVTQIAKETEPILLKGVQDHRLNTSNDIVDFNSWYVQWDGFQRILRQSILNTDCCMILTDITSFFDNIDHMKLRAMLLEHCSAERRPFILLVMSMLERWVHRPEYSFNSLRGLPQINLDTIHFLATFYLHEHDERIAEKNLTWFRWLDDMFILSSSTEHAMSVINQISSSVRDISLSINSGKTAIIENPNIFSVLSLDDFDKCKYFSNEECKSGSNIARRKYLIDDLKDSFNHFYYSVENRNWTKILRSYYNLFRRFESNYLNNFVINDLVSFPTIAEGIFDYLLHLNNDETLIPNVMNYMCLNDEISTVNELYGLKYLLKYRVINNDDLILDFANRAFTDKLNKRFVDISKCILSLIVAKYGKASDINNMIKYYNKYYNTDYNLWRSMLWVGLLVSDRRDYAELILKTSYDGSVQVSRMVRYIEEIKNYKGDIDERILYNIKNSKLINPLIHYLGIEIYILLKTLLESKENNIQLQQIVNGILNQNEDIIMSKKLIYLINNEKYKNDYDRNKIKELTSQL
jgi:hypothetical protein